ncbi:MAG TPA: outer membrane beta-barrel protein [Planctomycetota bacterium]|nr:outer membrane beta-barrel protein [Planctomycetota bacterium]
MPLLLLASLLGASSLTGGETAQPNGLFLPPAAYSPKDKDTYRDQDVASLTLLVGQRELDDSGWDPNDSQFTLGLEFDSYRPDNWVGVEAGFHYSDDDSGGGIGQNTEMFLGARKTFALGPVGLHPYVGAGASYIWATNGVDGAQVDPLLAGTIVAETDSSLGFYAHAGVYYTIARFNFGVDLRGLFGTDIDAFGAGDADYVQFAGTIGYGF